MTQFYEVYNHPRTEEGHLDREPRGGAPTFGPREQFFDFWRLRRLRDDQIEPKWREHVETLKRAGQWK